jgi:hypothetical protein
MTILSNTAQLSGLTVDYSLVVQNTLSFRQCVDGEILVNNQCLLCPSGGYSFRYDPLQPVTQCIPCPENSDDCYGSTIIVSPGYWRINQYAVILEECNYGSLACIGGDGMGVALPSRRLQGSASTFPEYVGICAIGYEGPLCGVCSANYYFSSTSNSCNTCKGQGQSQLATMILVPLVLLLLIVFFVFYNFILNEKSKFTKDKMNKDTLQDVGEGNIGNGASDIYYSSMIFFKKHTNSPAGKSLKNWMVELIKIMTPKVKIMLTVFQIISNLPFALNIRYTEATTKLFRAFRYTHSQRRLYCYYFCIELNQCLF